MTTTQIPGSIVKAVCAVMSTLDSVKKSQKNQHGGYMFSSTDDIYAAITRKMGEVGLLCLGLEHGEPEISKHEKDGKMVQWMKVTYAFVLATEDATWTDPDAKRTLISQITGPQTFQAAQSYAEKSYLRSLFKIPTGDMDLDSLPENYEYAPIVFKSREPAAVVPPPAPPAAPTEKEEAALPAPEDVSELEADFMNFEERTPPKPNKKQQASFV